MSEKQDRLSKALEVELLADPIARADEATGGTHHQRDSHDFHRINRVRVTDDRDTADKFRNTRRRLRKVESRKGRDAQKGKSDGRRTPAQKRRAWRMG
jgi:hypothetical protein